MRGYRPGRTTVSFPGFQDPFPKNRGVGGEFAIMPELIQLALKITPAAQLRERDQQVDGEDKEVPHTTNRTMAVSAR